MGIATTSLSSFGCYPQAPAQVPAAGQAIPKQGPRSTLATSRTVSVAPDDAEFRTPLFLVSTGGDNGVRTAVVALGRPVEGASKADTMGTIQSILERELILQALLIAARDELGLPTRDPILDEFAPPEDKSNANAVPVEIAILFRRNECRALVRRGDGENATILQKYDLGTNPGRGQLLGQLDGLGREAVAHRVPRAFKTARRDGQAQPRARRCAGAGRRRAAAGDVEHGRTLCRRPRFASRDPGGRRVADARGRSRTGLRAARDVDRISLELGPSSLQGSRPALRRAAPGAQPAAARSAQPLYTRAFVRALVGRHDLALADLDQADKLDQQLKSKGETPTPTPSWLPVIDAYLKADRTRLAKTEGPHARLAGLLGMMIVEYPPRTRLLIQTARNVISADADCYRAYDAICVNGDLGDLHMATESAPAAFTRLLPVKLGSLSSLPETVKKTLDQGGDEMTLVHQLEQAGRPDQDIGEPSWVHWHTW